AGQQVQAGDVTPALVGRRKVRADVAQARRAEHGVHNRVQQHIGVRMPLEAALVRDLDAAQHQPAARAQRVHVVALPDAQLHTHIISYMVQWLRGFSPLARKDNVWWPHNRHKIKRTTMAWPALPPLTIAVALRCRRPHVTLLTSVLDRRWRTSSWTEPSCLSHRTSILRVFPNVPHRCWRMPA